MANMGRPKSADPKTSPIMVKLTQGERAKLDQLVDAWREEAALQGVGQVTASSVIRALVMRDYAARGLDKAEGKKGGKR